MKCKLAEGRLTAAKPCPWPRLNTPGEFWFGLQEVSQDNYLSFLCTVSAVPMSRGASKLTWCWEVGGKKGAI